MFTKLKYNYLKKSKSYGDLPNTIKVNTLIQYNFISIYNRIRIDIKKYIYNITNNFIKINYFKFYKILIDNINKDLEYLNHEYFILNKILNKTYLFIYKKKNIINFINSLNLENMNKDLMLIKNSLLFIINMKFNKNLSIYFYNDLIIYINKLKNKIKNKYDISEKINTNYDIYIKLINDQINNYISIYTKNIVKWFYNLNFLTNKNLLNKINLKYNINNKLFIGNNLFGFTTIYINKLFPIN